MANKITVARLVGHTFGDASIHKNKKYFIYTNSNEELQRIVFKKVNELFGNITFNIGTSISKTPRYQYSNKVGKFLVENGAPVGSKVLQPTNVPNWILNGSEEIEATFLAAIFDDEGYFRNSEKCRQIVFKSAKELSLKKQLEKYLLQIIKMLQDLQIETSGIKKDQIKKRKDGKEIISLRFWITGKNNFSNFKEKIPILHPEKKLKLLNMAPTG